MRYVTEYTSIAEARKASADKAAAMGCKPGMTTRYWYPVHEHPSSKRAAMEVEDDYPAPNGKAKNTRPQMVAAGWFADEAR